MKRARVIMISVGILALGGLVFYLAWPSEPAYRGRKLSDWTKDLDGFGPKSRPAIQAIREIGTNAFPTYLRWLRAQDSPVKLKINQLLSRQQLIRYRLREDSVDKVMLAHECIQLLDTPAVPCLIGTIHDQSAAIGERRAALDCLCEIDRGRWIAESEFVQLLKCPERELSVGAAVILWKQYPEEAEKAGVYEMFPHWRPAPAKTNAQAPFE